MSGATGWLVKMLMRLEAISLPPTAATPATFLAASETMVETTPLEMPMPATWSSLSAMWDLLT